MEEKSSEEQDKKPAEDVAPTQADAPKEAESASAVNFVSASPTAQAGLSHDTKTILVVLCLFFFWPAGLILMWTWMKTWPTWVKVIISFPLLLAVLAVIFAIFMVARHPAFRTTQQWNTQQPNMMYHYPRPPMQNYGAPTPSTSSALPAPTKYSLPSKT